LVLERFRYKTRCFKSLPPLRLRSRRIRALGEQLDAHRKRQQAAHLGLTMTDMYNVLERVRELDNAGGSVLDARSPRLPPAASRLTEKEKKITSKA
jgi:hypothetical protein